MCPGRFTFVFRNIIIYVENNKNRPRHNRKIVDKRNENKKNLIIYVSAYARFKNVNTRHIMRAYNVIPYILLERGPCT